MERSHVAQLVQWLLSDEDYKRVDPVNILAIIAQELKANPRELSLIDSSANCGQYFYEPLVAMLDAQQSS